MQDEHDVLEIRDPLEGLRIHAVDGEAAADEKPLQGAREKAVESVEPSHPRLECAEGEVWGIETEEAFGTRQGDGQGDSQEDGDRNQCRNCGDDPLSSRLSITHVRSRRMPDAVNKFDSMNIHDTLQRLWRYGKAAGGAVRPWRESQCTYLKEGRKP